jgi:hypothetical protein
MFPCSSCFQLPLLNLHCTWPFSCCILTIYKLIFVSVQMSKTSFHGCTKCVYFSSPSKNGKAFCLVVGFNNMPLLLTLSPISQQGGDLKWLRFTEDWPVNDLCPRKCLCKKHITPNIIYCLEGCVNFYTHAITQASDVLWIRPTKEILTKAALYSFWE